MLAVMFTSLWLLAGRRSVLGLTLQLTVGAVVSSTVTEKLGPGKVNICQHTGLAQRTLEPYKTLHLECSQVDTVDT
jgi:hypothetical protein